jgi:hypothetical protein
VLLDLSVWKNSNTLAVWCVIRKLIVVFEGRNVSKSNISKLSNLESLMIRNYIKRRTLYKILRYHHTGEFQMFALNGFFALLENIFYPFMKTRWISTILVEARLRKIGIQCSNYSKHLSMNLVFFITNKAVKNMN